MAHADALLIDDLGGTTAVARLTKCPTSTVHSWRTSGIPESRFDHLRLAAKEAGIVMPERAQVEGVAA